MAVIQFSSDDQTLQLSAGVTVGTLLVRRHGCSLVGLGVGVSTLRLEGTPYPYGVFASAALDGAPAITSLRLADLTIDCDNLANLIIAVSSDGIQELILERVRIRGHGRNTISLLNNSFVRAIDCQIVGNGGGYQVHSGSTGQYIQNMDVWGCLWGYIVSDLGLIGVIPGGYVENFRYFADYWACPHAEMDVPVVSFGAHQVQVESHVLAHKSLYDVVRVLTPRGTFAVGATLPGTARTWDRVELDDGRWTQVVMVDGVRVLEAWRQSGTYDWLDEEPLGETAMLYDVTLGRTVGADATHLYLQTGGGVPATARWETVDGYAAATPSVVAGQRLDIIRHGISPGAVEDGVRDVDVAGIQVNMSMRNGWIKGAYIRGSFSDGDTQRGVDCRCEDIVVELNQDMAHTVDGTRCPQLMIRCVGRRAGYNGFAVIGGPSVLVACVAEDNGKHGEGWGVTLVKAARNSSIEVTGNGGVEGTVFGEDGHRSRSVNASVLLYSSL